MIAAHRYSTNMHRVSRHLSQTPRFQFRHSNVAVAVAQQRHYANGNGDSACSQQHQRALSTSANSAHDSFSSLLRKRHNRLFSSIEKTTPDPVVTQTEHMPSCISKLSRVVPVSANRCHLRGYDVKDESRKIRTYLDFQAGIGALSTGHAHAHVINAVKDQLDTIVHAQQNCLYSHNAQDALAPKLAQLMPKTQTQTLTTSTNKSDSDLNTFTHLPPSEQPPSDFFPPVVFPQYGSTPHVTFSSMDHIYTSPRPIAHMLQARSGSSLAAAQQPQGVKVVDNAVMDESVREAMESGFLTCAENQYMTHRAAPTGDTALAHEKYRTAGALDSFFWCNSGSEATDNAMKLARAWSGKTNIVSVNKGFHGRTFGAMTLTSAKLSYRRSFEPLVGSCFVLPEDSETAFNQLAETQLDFDNSTAAVIVELIQGEAGVVPLDVGFLEMLRAKCTEHDVLLIFDEVQTGAGRSGEFWATEHLPAHIRPDIITFAKGIASGFQLAGVAANKSVFGRLPANALGGTYGGNCVSVAAANATVDVVVGEKLVENSRAMGRRITEGVLKLIANWERDGLPNPILRMRQFGLFIAMDLDPELATISDVLAEAAENELLMLSAGKNTLRLLPPLVVGEAEVAEFMDKFDATVRAMM